MKKTSNLHQVGGDHYESLKIQPIKLFVRYNLNWFQGEAIKYLSRFPKKGGKQDIEKAIHILKLAITLEGESPTLFEQQDYDLKNDFHIETYVNQFRGDFFKEPCSIYYLRMFIYDVINHNYKRAIVELNSIIYAEYE